MLKHNQRIHLHYLLVFSLFLPLMGVAQRIPNVVTMAGGRGNERFETVFILSDSTVLIGGQADNLDWIPASVPRAPLSLPANIASNSSKTAFILHLASDLQTIIAVHPLPGGTVVNVQRIRSTSQPGQPTGVLYISGKREAPANTTGYYLARLNGNFVTGAPTGAEWVYNISARDRNGTSNALAYPAGNESTHKQVQPWDVGSDGRIVAANGAEFGFDGSGLECINADGKPGLMPYWSIHRSANNSVLYLNVPSFTYQNTTGDSSRNLSYSGLFLKYGGTGQKGSLRSYNQRLFDSVATDENGNGGRKGFYPHDFLFTSFENFSTNTPANWDGPGYLGLRAETRQQRTARIGAIEIDRRTNGIYIGMSIRADGITNLANNTDTETSVLAMSNQGQNLWWARLHQETPANSPIQQHVDKLAIDYQANQLVVVARCRGEIPYNFWRGNQIRLNPGGAAFQNRLTGIIKTDDEGADFSWIGKYNLVDGKIRYSTYLASLANVGNKGVASTDPNLPGWPNLNLSQPDLGQTIVNDIQVESTTGDVVLGAIGVRMPTSLYAFQQMVPFVGRPNGGQVEAASFVARLSGDLSRLKYSSLLTGIWNPLNASNGNNTFIGTVAARKGVVMAVGYHSGVGSRLPTVNRPAWGSDSVLTETAILARLNTEIDSIGGIGPLAGSCPVPPRAAQGDTCGPNYKFSIAPVSCATRYIWVVNGSGWQGNSDSSSLVLTRSTPANGGYAVVIPVFGDVLGLQRVIQLPSANPVATPVLANFPSKVCNNTTQAFSFNPVNGARRYLYTLSGPGCSSYVLDSASSASPVASIRLIQPTQVCSLGVQAVGCAGPGALGSFELPRPGGQPASPRLTTSFINICEGQPAFVSVIRDSLAIGYEWNISGFGYTIDANGGSAAIRADNTAFNGLLTVRAIGACGPGPQASFPLGSPLPFQLPAPPSRFVLPAQQCPSTTSRYAVDSAFGTRYEFALLNTNWTVNSRGTANILVTSPAAANTTTLLARAVNTCGVSSYISTIIRSGRPDLTGNLSPVFTNVCAGSTFKVTIPAALSAVNYTWTLPAGLIGSSDSNSILITVSAGFTGGQVEVVANNACGTSDPKIIVYGGAALQTLTPVINPSGAALQCRGISKTYWVVLPTISAASTINWTLPRGWYFANSSRQAPASDTIVVSATPQAQAGNLSVIVSDASNCGSSSIAIAPGDLAATGTVTGQQVFCPNPGRSTFTVTGGATGLSYTYRVEPAAAGTLAQTGNTASLQFSPTFTGTAFIKANTVSCGATIEASALQVQVNSPANAEFSGLDSLYCTLNPAITLTPVQAGGQFYVDNLAVSTIVLATAGRYTVRYIVSQGAGCADTVSKTVRVGTVARPTFANTTDTVCGSNSSYQLNGATPTGGVYTSTAPVSAQGLVTLTPALGGQTLTFTYTLTSGSCSASADRTLYVQPAPNITFARPLDTACSNVLTYNLADATPAGGVYSALGGIVSPEGLLSISPGLVGTNITVNYNFGRQGCSGSASKTVYVRDVPVPVITAPSDTLCLGGTSVNLTPSLAGGVFSGSQDVSTLGEFTPRTLGQANILYTLTTGGCTAVARKSLFVQNSVQAGISNLPASICANSTSLQLTASPAGGAFSGTGVSQTGLLDVTGLAAGSYQVTYTQTSGACNLPASGTYVVQALPIVNAGPDLTLCVNGSVDLVAPTTGGTWTGTSVSSTGSINTGSLAVGTVVNAVYSITANGCSASDNVQVTIRATPTLTNTTPVLTIETGQTSAAFGVASSENPASIAWTPAAGLSSASILMPTANPQTSTVYNLVASYGTNCSATTQVTVTVTPPIVSAIEIPNAFSPNGDGANDTWQIDNISGKPNSKVEVFNRYGTRLLSRSAYKNDWNGDNLPAGTYYYVVDYGDGSGKKSGSLTITK